MPSTAVSSAAEPPATSISPTRRPAKRKREETALAEVQGEETSTPEEAARSVLLSLLHWHGNGSYILGDPHAEGGDSSREEDEDFDDGSLRDHRDFDFSVLAEHLKRLGFRVGQSVPTSPSASSSHASSHPAAVSVYRDSMSIVENRAAAKGAETQNSTETEARAGTEIAKPCGNEHDHRRAFWISLLGMHPHQSEIEQTYCRYFRSEYCMLLLLDLLLERLAESAGSPRVCPVDCGEADDNAPVRHEEKEHIRNQMKAIKALQAQCLDLMVARLSNEGFQLPRSSFPSSEVRIALHGKNQLDWCEYDDDDGDGIIDARNLFEWLHAKVFAGTSATPLCTVDQLRVEHARIRARNSTLSNAYLQLWQRSCRRHPALQLTRIEYHASPNPKFERFKLFVNEQRHRNDGALGLTLLPCLPHVVNLGIDATARHLVESFWGHLDRVCHYQSTSDLRKCVSPSLSRFFASGLSTPSSPSCISLEAKFVPRYRFSLYLHGEPGTGKSSFVRCFARALQRVLNESIDPSIYQLDTVKQMLNKAAAELELDLELRRNNNDLSLSSLVMSRRQRNRAFGLSDPATGLVVLALEELAPPSSMKFAEGSGTKRQLDNSLDPNQHATLNLLTQRLSGRSGQHTMESHVRSNGVVRSGVSGDPTILTLMTSNYELTDASGALLRQVPLFENIAVVAMKAVEDADRRNFASSYFNRFVSQQLRLRDPCSHRRSSSRRRYAITLDLQEGCGDVRPLVRRLRMLAYYVAAQVNLPSSKTSGEMIVNVAQRSDDRCTITLRSDEIEALWELQTGSVSDLYVTSIVSQSFFRPETRQMLDSIRVLSFQNDVPCAELVMFFEFWLTGALAPAVVLSTRDEAIASIVSTVSDLDEVHVLKQIDVSSYRMMKSLYDPVDTPNLRDDIRRLGKGKAVVVELLCRDVASQLCIRELIEDTPSMTAYSSDRSALHKEGLLFLVRITGSAITPEIRSRASLIL